VQQQLNSSQPGQEIPSAVPRSWVLKKTPPGGNPAEAGTVATGVMAFTVAADGTVYYSTGRGVYLLAPDSRSPKKVNGRPLVTCLFAAKM